MVGFEHLDLLLQTDKVVEPGDFRRHVIRASVMHHLHQVEHPRKLIVFTGILDQLDEDLIELKLFRCNVVSNQLVRAKCISESIKMERLDGESIGSRQHLGSLATRGQRTVVPWDLPWDPFCGMACGEGGLG